MTVHRSSRRPPAVVAAVVLMVPVVVTWAVAGVAFMVAVVRTPGDYRVLLWILGLAVLALCGLVALMGTVGLVQAWRGRSTLMRIPAAFTAGLFFLALLNLIVRGRVSYHPTQITPLVVGAMAGVAFRLTHSRSAKAWFAQLR